MIRQWLEGEQRPHSSVHILDRLFIGALGISRGSLTALVVVWLFLYDMIAKKHSWKPNWSPWPSDRWCGRWQHLRGATQDTGCILPRSRDEQCGAEQGGKHSAGLHQTSHRSAQFPGVIQFPTSAATGMVRRTCQINLICFFFFLSWAKIQVTFTLHCQSPVSILDYWSEVIESRRI